jgi:hypothetical protein
MKMKMMMMMMISTCYMTPWNSNLHILHILSGYICSFGMVVTPHPLFLLHVPQ